MGAKIIDHGPKVKVPGPGTYEAVDGVKNDRGNKFGGGDRTSLGGAKGSPGPGQHNPEYQKTKNAAPKFGFGTETRNDIGGMGMGPGPGGYNITSMIGAEGQKNTLHATIDYTPEAKEGSYKPGPGTYHGDYKSVRNKSPAYKLGTAPRDNQDTKRLKFTVSPNKYNPSFSATKSSTAKWGFGTGKRVGLGENGKFVPGAGQYEIPSSINENQKYSMGAKLNLLEPLSKKNPGPGSYNTQDMQNLNMKFSAKYGFGKDKRS